jgi:hypothetical protein
MTGQEFWKMLCILLLKVVHKCGTLLGVGIDFACSAEVKYDIKQMETTMWKIWL